MGRFSARTVEELRARGVEAFQPAPSLLILGRAGGTRLLVSAHPLMAPGGEGPELFEEDRIAPGQDMASLGARDGVLLHDRRLWKPLDGSLCPDSADELMGALEVRPGRRRGSTSAPALAVLSLPAHPPDAGRRLALWLSRADHVPVRPLGFLGGEHKATVLRAPLCTEHGVPVVGHVLVSAHVVVEGGRVAWRLPLHVEAEEGDEA